MIGLETVNLMWQHRVPLEFLWSLETGATESVIAPQSPPVNMLPRQTGAGDFPSNPAGDESLLLRQAQLVFLELLFLNNKKKCFLLWTDNLCGVMV